MEPFHIDIPDEDLVDLKLRLDRTRWPEPVDGPGWDHGADLGYLAKLCDYWRSEFDWRAEEARLNAWPHYVTSLCGHRIHFIHIRGRGENPLPLLLLHGWPSSFDEFALLAPLLSDPGGDGRDAFDLVIPSYPGFGFSAPFEGIGKGVDDVARLWLQLMTETLGYSGFLAHGGDVGGAVVNRLARDPRVIAVHTISSPRARMLDDPPLSDAEKAYLARFQRWGREEGGYAHIQGTRPQSLTMGLNDSPAGLAAWILDKWRAWSDCGGDIEKKFSRDRLLANISLYWFTGTIATAAKIYLPDPHARETSRITTPTRLFLTAEPVNLCPREWAERTYSNLSYDKAPRGGHFLALEEPELLAEDITSYFRAFR